MSGIGKDIIELLFFPYRFWTNFLEVLNFELTPFLTENAQLNVTYNWFNIESSASYAVMSIISAKLSFLIKNYSHFTYFCTIPIGIYNGVNQGKLYYLCYALGSICILWSNLSFFIVLGRFIYNSYDHKIIIELIKCCLWDSETKNMKYLFLPFIPSQRRL